MTNIKKFLDGPSETAGGKILISYNDWGFDENVDNVVEAARGFWPGKKKHGAVNIRAQSWVKKH